MGTWMSEKVPVVCAAQPLYLVGCPQPPCISASALDMVCKSARGYSCRTSGAKSVVEMSRMLLSI